MNKKSITEQIAEIVKEARIASGLTQVEVADKLDFDTPQFVSLMERGKSKIPLMVLGKLCKLLNIDADEIAGMLIADYASNVSREIELGFKSI